MAIRARVWQLMPLLSLVALAALSCCHWSRATAAESEAPAASPSSPSFPQCRVSSQVEAARSSSPESRVPTLLFWDTEGVNYQMYDVWFGSQGYYRCPVECRVKSGRSRADFAAAEAVLFWATPIAKELPLDAKCPGQLWIQSSTEAFDVHILDRTPPGGVMADGTPSPIDLEVSWRRSLGPDRVSWLSNWDWNSVRDMEALWDAAADAPLQPATKTRAGRDPDQAAVAAFISNCGAQSPRLELLSDLQRAIRVDSFGACAHNKDVPESWGASARDLSRGLLAQKNRVLAARYKFLLAFENQETPDYVTEKFFAPVQVGVLPVVLGAQNVAEYAPHAEGQGPSFINVRDFPLLKNGSDAASSQGGSTHGVDVAALAAHLDYLDRNDTAYLEYFAWRQRGAAARQFGRVFAQASEYSWLDSPCQVCQSIHQKLYGRQPVSIRPEHWDRRRPPPPMPTTPTGQQLQHEQEQEEDPEQEQHPDAGLLEPEHEEL